MILTKLKLVILYLDNYFFFRSNSDELNQTIQSLERQKESSDIKNTKLEENLGEHKKVFIYFCLFLYIFCKSFTAGILSFSFNIFFILDA